MDSPDRGSSTIITQHRIAIIGPGGSGKTTFAKRLAERQRLPAIHLDDHLTTGSRYVSDEEQRRRTPPLISGDEWIVEGSYWRVADLLFASATIVVVLDEPLYRTLPRFLRRELRGRWAGWGLQTARDLFDLRSALFWTCLYPLVERRRVLRAARAPSVDARVIIAKNIADAERQIDLAIR